MISMFESVDCTQMYLKPGKGGVNQLETFECMFKTETINRLPRFMSVRTIHVHYFVFIICTDSR